MATKMATKKAMDTDVVNINLETLFNKVKSSGESKTHTSLHKKLILCNKNSKLQLAGRLKTL